MVSHPDECPQPSRMSWETSRRRQLSLEVHKNPIETFYKDEGGKSNFLTASIRIASNDNAEDLPIGNLKLFPRLIYESGGEIEDEDEIFNVINVEPKTVTSTNELFTVNFRIEKVSRRKDGKRFRVRFDVNEQKSHLLDYVSMDSLHSVETAPVTVLSKRKSHGQMNGTSTRSGLRNRVKTEDTGIRRRMATMSVGNSVKGTKRRASHDSRTGKKKTVTLPVDFLLKLRENMASLESAVKILASRVTVLEQSQRKPPTMNQPHSRGMRVHSLMFEDIFPEEANNPNFQGNGNCTAQAQLGIKRNGSSTQELFEFLNTSLME